MKVLLTIWISAVLMQEVIPSTLVRLPRHASKQPSLVHTEYEAKYEQRGKHGNESSGLLTGKQEIVHDHCSDDWNAFADKCAALIKDLVASLANAVSSQPGDATNLQLQIKNTFRHFDNTNNCTCFNHSDIDLSPLFDNITVNTIAPSTNINGGNGGKASNCGGGSQSCVGDSDLKNGIVSPVSSGDGGEGNESNDGNGNNSGLPQKSRQPNVPLNQAEDPGVSPEGDGGSDSTNNSRRQAKYPQISRQPGNSQPYYPQKPNNIKRAPYPFLVTPQPNSSPSPLGTVPYSNDNNLPNGGNVGNGPGLNGQTPPTLMTAGPATDAYSKPVVGVPAVAVPADGESNKKPAAFVHTISAPVGPNLGKGDTFPNASVTYNGPGSNTEPIVPDGTTPVLTSSKPNRDHLSPQNKILRAPVINSQSNLPESEGPESQGGTTNPLSTAPGPNPSIAVVKDPNSAIPEVLPISTTPTMPEADNHQSGVPSDAGNSLTKPAVLPTIVVPASDTEGRDKKEENSSGNGNAVTSPLPVYPVYVPKTNSPSGLAGSGSGPEDGLGGSVPAVVPNNSPTSQGGEDYDSNTGAGNNGTTPVTGYPAKVPVAVPQNVGQTGQDCDDCDSNTGTNSDGTTPVVPPVEPLPALPQYAGPTGQGSPLTTAGSGPGGDQNESSPTVLSPVPVAKTASEDCDDCDSNTGANNGTTPVVGYPSKVPAAVPKNVGQTGQDCDDCDSNTGSNSAGTTPVAVETPLADPQNAGQTGPGTPVGNAGSGPVGDLGESVPSVIPSAVPIITPTSQDGEDCDSNTGTGNNATTPAVMHPVKDPLSVPQNAGHTGQDCDDCDSNTGTEGGITPVAEFPVDPPVAVPSNAGPTGQGSGGPLTNPGLGPADGLVESVPSVIPSAITKTTPTSQDGEEFDSNTGTGNDTTTPVAVPSNAEPTGHGSGTALAVSTAIPVLPVINPTSQAGDGSGLGTKSTSPYPPVLQPIEPALHESGSPASNSGSGQTESHPPAVSDTTSIPIPDSLGAGEPQPTGSEGQPFDSGIENLSPTTFQTTSSDPTSPQSILIPTASTQLDPEPSAGTSTSPQTQESHADDEDDEDCCSCESCTEEEITDPKQYKENACKNLEEARRELKAIFDKIKKKLKCGRKGVQTITTTASVNSN